jgi:hypothetical protein
MGIWDREASFMKEGTMRSGSEQCFLGFLQGFGVAQATMKTSNQIKNCDTERPEGISQSSKPSLCNEGWFSRAWYFVSYQVAPR